MTFVSDTESPEPPVVGITGPQELLQRLARLLVDTRADLSGRDSTTMRLTVGVWGTLGLAFPALPPWPTGAETATLYFADPDFVLFRGGMMRGVRSPEVRKLVERVVEIARA